MARKRKVPLSDAWQAYWKGGPHPDSEVPRSSQRVLAPFRGGSGPTTRERIDARESFYCHHYRQKGEHYHKTFAELEACEE